MRPKFEQFLSCIVAVLVSSDQVTEASELICFADVCKKGDDSTPSL